MSQPSDNSDAGLPRPIQERIDEVCDRFESAWKASEQPKIEDYLANWQEKDRDSFLRELICVDLEYRWRSSKISADQIAALAKTGADPTSANRSRDPPPVLEDYAAQFPEIGPLDELPLELVCQEYHVRHLWGDRPGHETYMARFPSLRSSLPEVLSQVDAALRKAVPTSEVSTVSFAGPEPTKPSPSKTLRAQDIPDAIGKYRVISALDSGGQADVYRAVHPTLDKELVVKLAHQSAEGSRRLDMERLVAEGKLLADLEHPNLARIYDLDLFEGRPFLVMEYIRGRNLQQTTGGEPVPSQQAASLVAKVARALAVAHAHGVVHKDIKPQNILIDPSGEPRIIDFGLAQLRDAWADETEEPSHISGTIHYMPPEQARGETDRINERSDVFALGAVLYYLLTGKPPFAGKTIDQSLRMAAQCEFDHDLLKRKDIDPHLVSICLRAMAAEPSERFASANQLADALDKRGKRHSFGTRVNLGPIGCGLSVTLACLLLISVTAVYQATYQMQAARSKRSEAALPMRNKAERAAHSAMRSANKAPEMSGKLEILVWQNDQPRNLASAVPLRTGDDLQVVYEAPVGLHVALFWFDTESKLHSLPLEEEHRTDKVVRYVWPRPRKIRSLGGPTGTELIFVCASSDEMPRSEDIGPLLSEAGPWPDLPKTAVLELKRDSVRLSGTRGPVGQERDRPDDLITRRADKLRIGLADKYEVVQGVAFFHAESP